MKTMSSKGSRQVSRPTQMDTKGSKRRREVPNETNVPRRGTPLNDSTKPVREMVNGGTGRRQDSQETETPQGSLAQVCSTHGSGCPQIRKPRALRNTSSGSLLLHGPLDRVAKSQVVQPWSRDRHYGAELNSRQAPPRGRLPAVSSAEPSLLDALWFIAAAGCLRTSGSKPFRLPYAMQDTLQDFSCG